MKLVLGSVLILIAFSLDSMAGTFKLTSTSCAEYLADPGKRLVVEIIHFNQVEDQATVRKVAPDGSETISVLKVYPQLPNDPEANYSLYKGEKGSFFELRIFNKEWECPTGKCNSILSYSKIGEGVPVHMYTSVVF